MKQRPKMSQSFSFASFTAKTGFSEQVKSKSMVSERFLGFFEIKSS